MVKLINTLNNKIVEAEIVPAVNIKMPLKKDGWLFNWKNILKRENTQTFVLRLKDTPHNIEGVLQLRIESEMLIMDLIEIAPHNIGKNKRYNNVAGSLIAFACRESFKIEGPYQGFLTFDSKTDLIEWYIENYGAEVAIRQKMFISPDNGIRLIAKYLI